MQFTLPFIKLSIANYQIPTNDDCTIDENSNEEDNTLLFGRQQSSASQLQSLDSQSTAHPFPQDTQTKAIPKQPSPSSQLRQDWSSSSSVMMPSLQTRPLPTTSSQSMIGPSLSMSESTSRPSKKKGRKSDSKVEYLKAKQARKESIHDLEQNPKKMFLLSLLPDLEPMSDGQMRVFKRRVMQVIEEIFNDRPSTSAMQNSETTLFYENITPVLIAEPDTDDSNTEDVDIS